jgi:hypothetical protein
MTPLVFAVLLVGAPIVPATKIRAQRPALGRSPVVFGRAGRDRLEAWFERLSLSPARSGRPSIG